MEGAPGVRGASLCDQSLPFGRTMGARGKLRRAETPAAGTAPSRWRDRPAQRRHWEVSMRRVISILALLALVTGVAVTGVAPPATAEAASSRPQEYLALGDSLAFGFSPLVDPASAANFIGYPDTVAAALNEHLTNAACPGETSSHLISLTGSDYGCGPWRANFPLHVTYSTTQLAFAEEFLKSHPKTLVVS